MDLDYWEGLGTDQVRQSVRHILTQTAVTSGCNLSHAHSWCWSLGAVSGLAAATGKANNSDLKMAVVWNVRCVIW
jgi:hypothetical protein